MAETMGKRENGSADSFYSGLRRMDLMVGDEGIRRLPDGKYCFRFQTAAGKKVTLRIGNAIPSDKNPEYKMVDEAGKGDYKLILSSEEIGKTGYQKVEFFVDDISCLNPVAGMGYLANTLSNGYEFQGSETEVLVAKRPDVPHGTICHEYVYSSVMDEYVNMTVYTPPGYEDGVEYPVLYLFHEIGEFRVAWTNPGLFNFQMDNMIADGLCRPFIIVENDCTLSRKYKEQKNWYSASEVLEKVMLTDVIPAIENKYKISGERDSRGMAGYGLGAVQAGYIFLRNPELFSCFGTFTAFWPSANFHEEGKQDAFYDGVLKTMAYPEPPKVFYFSEGDSDGHFESTERENNMLIECGVGKLPGYQFEKFEGLSHGYNLYRLAMSHFAPLIFK